MRRLIARAAVIAAVFAVGFVLGRRGDTSLVLSAQAAAADRVFELRTYTAPEGKLPALEARFRDHTMDYFEKHGMTSVGYWTPQDAPEASNTIVYLLAHPSRAAARENWAAFSADPGWQEVSRASQVDGRIVSKVVSVFLDPTDFSPIK